MRVEITKLVTKGFLFNKRQMEGVKKEANKEQMKLSGRLESRTANKEEMKFSERLVAEQTKRKTRGLG